MYVFYEAHSSVGLHSMFYEADLHSVSFHDGCSARFDLRSSFIRPFYAYIWPFRRVYLRACRRPIQSTFVLITFSKVLNKMRSVLGLVSILVGTKYWQSYR